MWQEKRKQNNRIWREKQNESKLECVAFPLAMCMEWKFKNYNKQNSQNWCLQRTHAFCFIVLKNPQRRRCTFFSFLSLSRSNGMGEKKKNARMKGIKRRHTLHIGIHERKFSKHPRRRLWRLVTNEAKYKKREKKSIKLGIR